MKGPQKTTERLAVYRKDLHAAVAHFLKENVPALSGDLICKPVADEIVKLADHYLPKTDHMRPGQVLWYGIAADETSGYGKKIEDCKVTPVIVDLINDQDIEDYIKKTPKRDRQKNVAVRLHNQAFKQGAVFSYYDSAAIMRLSPSTVGKYIRNYEKETGNLVPRRGNVHDIGPTLTHKRIICIKHLKEGKTVEETARETNHSPEAVVRYTSDFRRIQLCLKEGFDLCKISQTTGLSHSLIEQYVDLIEDKDKVIRNDAELPF